MLSISGDAGGALLAAFLITMLELTEVVAVVYALGAGAKSMLPGAAGAVSGAAVVGGISLGIGFGLGAIPIRYTLVVGALLLYGFGCFLLRSTVKTYFREAKKAAGIKDPFQSKEGSDALDDRALFAGAFSVGAIEMLEAAVVLIAIAAGGFAIEAVIGFAVGATILIVIGFVMRESIRKIKIPQLKWLATSLLFTFAVFWSLESLVEAGRLSWPQLGGVPDDVLILPIFLIALLFVRIAVDIGVKVRMTALAASKA